MWKDSAHCEQTTPGQTGAGCLQRKLSKPQDHSSKQHPSMVSAKILPLSSCRECLPWLFLHDGLWAIRCHKSSLLRVAFGHDIETLLGQRTLQNMAILQVPGYRGAVFSHTLGAAGKVLQDSWLRRHQGIHLSVGSWPSPGVCLFHLHIKSTKVPWWGSGSPKTYADRIKASNLQLYPWPRHSEEGEPHLPAQDTQSAQLLSHISLVSTKYKRRGGEGRRVWEDTQESVS